MRLLPTIQGNADDGCCLVIDYKGKFAAIGLNSEIKSAYGDRCEEWYDATGQSVVPGLVDGHTHTVWAGDRVHEFAMKLEGATYMDIHNAGGGIHSTVQSILKASEDELYTLFKSRLLQLLKGKTAKEATEDILTNQIPKLKELCDKGELHIDNIDVFCEKGYTQGWPISWLETELHAEEFVRLHSVEMGAELNATAMSHLEEISDEGIKAMAEKGCVATILPTTAYLLHLKPPPVRKMIEEGCQWLWALTLTPTLTVSLCHLL
ncbi:AMDHD1 [Bugula neritina]|uniref:imidazolonepropionase n=1 Tax=Bugula neritina TaxID=10212 RepID=A0A7J7KFD3_BUGNE|nr:AMDHD1 [Bugula neritina]